jgi:ubiquitin-conjugating enzyme E2 J1
MQNRRILLPPEYPFKPPHIVFLNQSGRFETNTKICLSFSAFHPELWQPAWGIRLILEALIAFLPSPADGAIGALDWSPAERKRLAAKSKDFCCPLCGKIASLLPPLKEKSSPVKPSRFQKEIEELQRIQMLEHHKKEGEQEANQSAPHDKEKGHEESANTSSDRHGTKVAGPMPSAETLHAAGETPTPPPVCIDIDANGRANSIAHKVASDMEGSGERAAAASNEVPATIPVANNTSEAPVADAKPSWLVEQTIHLTIAVLSVICALLLRKVQTLLAELQALEE